MTSILSIALIHKVSGFYRTPILPSFVNRVIRMSTASSTPQWDAEAGVWKGDRALTSDIEVPKPLYIFGYGSLMFKPQESFARCERFDGLVYGWQRLWAQRSTDHRGTPDKPGLVCTVLSDADLESIGIRKAEDPPSNVHGVAYLIPEEQTQEVLDELDFREKGGYTRVVVDVHLTNVAGEESKTIKALLYAATTDNPNYYKPATMEEAAHIIAWGRGPSGENKEYLFEVASYLRRAGATCSETYELATYVENVLQEGVDRRSMLDSRYKHQPIWHRLYMYAWGSNQHGQLGWQYQEGGTALKKVDDLPQGGERGDYDKPIPTCIDIDLATSPATIEDSGRHVRQLEAGGGHSGIVMQDDKLFLWGWNDAGQTAAVVPRLDGLASQLRPFPRHVNMIALGHAHTLILERNTGKVYGLGGNAAGEATGHLGPTTNICEEGGGLLLLPGWADSGPVPLKWIAAGVKHSAGVTREGELVTWGSRKYGEGLPSTKASWRPSDGAKVVKVWCGWRHTVILDDQGRVWTIGSNKYGQLGYHNDTSNSSSDGSEPKLVEWPSSMASVVVKDIACGWSHTIVLTSSLEVWGWGRNTFGQLAKAPSSTVGNGEESTTIMIRPIPLLNEGHLLPNGMKVTQVKCGTESSLLVGEDGSLWSCGWNEHGNLGLGDIKDRHVWTQISIPSEEVITSKRFVACGGAHVFVLDGCP